MKIDNLEAAFYEMQDFIFALPAGDIETDLDVATEELQAVKKLVESIRWIPTSERLPEIGGNYFVVVKYKYDFEKEYSYDTDFAEFTFSDGYIDNCWNTYNDWNEGQQYLHITHWMPIPEPPKEESE